MTIRVKLPTKWKILPETKARKIYHSKDYWSTLRTEHRRVVYRSLCFWSIPWFASRITKRWTTAKKTGKRYPIPEFHKELWKISLEGGDIVIVCPRGFAKSTAISKILALWFLLFEIEPSILLISSKGLGEVVIGDIRRELEENKLIKYIWGELVPTDNKHINKLEMWRQSYLQLLNGTEIKTLSKGQAVRGQRPTLILVDDPEENKDVKNPIIAKEFFNWVFTTLYPALDDGGRMLVLGTIISSNCFINTLKAEAGERGFRLFEYAAILNFDEKKIRVGTLNGKRYCFFDEGIGQPLWPGKWSLKKLEKRYNKVKHDPFMQEMMHIPLIVNGSPRFNKKYTYTIMKPIDEIEGFQIYRPLTELIKYNAFIGIDLADGNEKGDFTTVWIRNEKYELLATWRGHIAQDILAEFINKIIPYFKDVFIVPENNKGLTFITAAKKYDWFFKIYRKVIMDKVTNKQTEEVGFNTNIKTKPLLINDLDECLREGDFEITAEELDEILHYYYDEKGGMNAISPWHDDTVIGDALSVQAVQHGLLAPLLTVF